MRPHIPTTAIAMVDTVFYSITAISSQHGVNSVSQSTSRLFCNSIGWYCCNL